jgi:hypothetical protein
MEENVKKVLLATIAALLILAGNALAEAPTLTWDYIDDSPDYTEAKDILYDSSEPNLFAIGLTKTFSDQHYCTMVYTLNSTLGLVLDKDLKNIDGNHTVAKAACMGEEPGEVITTGSWHNGNNSVIWTSGYSSGDWTWDITNDSDTMQVGRKVMRDQDENIYVVGTTYNFQTGADVTVIKYNSSRERVWRTTYANEGEDNVYGIIGLGSGFFTLLLENKLSDDMAFSVGFLTTDGTPSSLPEFTGRTNLGGIVPGGACYESSSPYQAADDTCFYICGTIDDGSGKDIWVACCDYEGNYLWEKVFDSGHDDEAHDIAMGFGYVYVVGSSGNGTDSDVRMIRYDEAGAETWNVIYDDGADESLNTICFDPAGNFYVGGYTQEDTVRHALLIKYNQPDVIAVEEQPSPSSPSSLTLEVADNLSSAPTIRYSLPQGQHGTLTFYSVDGRTVETFSLSSSQSTFTWPVTHQPSGVYFVELTVGCESVTAKIVLTK